MDCGKGQALQQEVAVALVVVQLAEQLAVHHVKSVVGEHAAVHPWPAEDQHLGPDLCG